MVPKFSTSANLAENLLSGVFEVADSESAIAFPLRPLCDPQWGWAPEGKGAMVPNFQLWPISLKIYTRGFSGSLIPISVIFLL